MKYRFLLRKKAKPGLLPVFHQPILGNLIDEVKFKYFDSEEDKNYEHFTFSTLKGQSKIERNFVNFNGNRVHWIVSALNNEWMEKLAACFMQQGSVLLDQMECMFESYEIVPEPEFTNKMKYVCLSPIILFDPDTSHHDDAESIDPLKDQFSDIMFDTLMDRMEKIPGNTYPFEEFSKFQVLPDLDYLEKQIQAGKKVSRTIPLGEQKTKAYLFPFTLYAHPKVQEYVYNSGIGAMCSKGFGAVDLL
jgi:CRISPR-associated endoribonuclease Cas6